MGNWDSDWNLVKAWVEKGNILMSNFCLFLKSTIGYIQSTDKGK